MGTRREYRVTYYGRNLGFPEWREETFNKYLLSAYYVRHCSRHTPHKRKKIEAEDANFEGE